MSYKGNGLKGAMHAAVGSIDATFDKMRICRVDDLAVTADSKKPNDPAFVFCLSEC